LALDWNDLRIGLAIVRAGSLSGAAAALGITHTTVGRRLTALESELGATLFRRSTQGLTPTPAGEALAARATEIEARVERLRDATSLGGDGPAGVVRLAGESWAIERLIKAGLPGLLAAHPRIELRTLGGRNRVSLWRGEPGLGLWMHEDTQEGCFALKLGVPPLAVYASRAATPPEDAWIALHDEEAGRDDRTRAFERLRRAGAGIPLTALDYGTVREAIAAGAGRGVLPVSLGAADPRLVQVGPAPDEAGRPLYLHLHPDTLDMPRIQTVSDWIRRRFVAAFGEADAGTRP
jgi:DNA-binding transcriptional LysR family regulator